MSPQNSIQHSLNRQMMMSVSS